MQDLDGQEPPTILSARQSNLKGSRNQEKAETPARIMTLTAKEVEKSGANTRNQPPQAIVPKPNAQTAGIASKTHQRQMISSRAEAQKGAQVDVERA